MKLIFKPTAFILICLLSFGCKSPSLSISLSTLPKIISPEVIPDSTLPPTTPTPTACPENFILVPGNITLGTREFCVGKFHAKNNNGHAEVTALGVPWDNINPVDAQAKCEAMTESGFSGIFTLISNPEWMTIARNAELMPENWSSGIVGTGHIVRGHSDGDPNYAMEVTDESDPYNGTNNNAGEAGGGGWEQRRTMKLSNGNIIWDFSGNIWSWVDWINTDIGFTISPLDSALTSMELTTLSGSITANDLQPLGGYDSSQSFGQWWGAGGVGGAALRGGRWGNNYLAGPFSMYLNDGLTSTVDHNGFRCVYRP